MQEKGRATNAASADRRSEHKDVQRTERAADDAAAQQPAFGSIDAGHSGRPHSEIPPYRSGESANQSDPENAGSRKASTVIDGHGGANFRQQIRRNRRLGRATGYRVRSKSSKDNAMGQTLR